jgi:SAM-dependent methyltransferase
MLERARGRATAGDGPPARLLVADMRALPGDLGPFDLVCLLDDALNYLDSPAEVEATLRGVARVLAPDGVVMFDANTLAAYRSFFATAGVVRDGDRLLVWDGHADPRLEAGGACTAELHAFAPGADGGGWTHALSVHRQRHHPRETVAAALSSAGLAWSEVHGMDAEGALAPLDELVHTKAVHVARLSEPQRGEGR